MARLDRSGGDAQSSAVYGQGYADAVARRDWRKQLGIILMTHNQFRAKDGRTVSAATLNKRQDILNQAFETLRQQGIKFQDIRSFKRKHVDVLIKLWLEQDLSTAVIHNRISVLRTYCGWIGKSSMLPTTDVLLPLETGKTKRTYVATEDKSWITKGVEPEKIISMVSAYDPWVGLQLRLMKEFGLRRKEAVMLQPHLVEEDDGSGIQIYKGTKGGRFRKIPYVNQAQRNLIKEAQGMVYRKNGYVADPDRTLEQNLNRFNNVLKRFGITKSGEGITSHGLRHQYANDRFEQQMDGQTTPVRGGNVLGVPSEKVTHVRHKIAEELGHGRIGITNAYYGKFPVKK